MIGKINCKHDLYENIFHLIYFRFNEPVKLFFNTMKKEWEKLVEKTKSYDEVKNV